MAFDLPEWCGQNWDAVYDLLRTETDVNKVIIIGEETVVEDLRSLLPQMHKVFDDFAEFSARFHGVFSYEIIS